MNKTTEERIVEIINKLPPMLESDLMIIRLELESLVIQAQIEQLQIKK